MAGNVAAFPGGNAQTLAGLPGAAYIQPRGNLLINGDFRRPVNQRGKEEYTTVGPVYTIDGWLISFDTLTLENGAVSRVVTPGGNGQHDMLFQRVENPERFAGRRLTATLEYEELSGVPAFLCVYDGAVRHSKALPPGSGTVCLTCTMSAGIKSLHVAVWHGETTGAVSMRPLRMKLEEGERFTGFYPIDPALELARCQRHFVRYAPEYGNLVIGDGKALADNIARIVLSTPVPMRINPTPVFSGVTLLKENGAILQVAGYSMARISQNALCLDITSSGLTTAELVQLRLSEGSFLELDAGM